jgi:competence ComEA-like helix-hairpin-helix protein
MARTEGRGERVDINRADPDALTSIEGIDGARAEIIVKFREEHGPFHSWEEVEEVDGIGSTLVEKLKEQGSLGDAGADGQAAAAEEDVPEELEEEALIDALTGLADLDAEAAAGYSVAAHAASDEETARQLVAFQADHRRHIQDLNAILRDLGAETVEEMDPDESLFASLAETAANLGDAGLLLAMIGNEHLTNASYRAAMELPAREEIQSVVAANFDDEQRHLRWLLEVGARYLEMEEIAEGTQE